ncbi:MULTISPECIES: hypothetical protein [Streptomyces]|uniref:Uncharacterized protein n=1 Tax=Streptomyces venezuelae TaxID=54571 RepID=A0A5P2B563_STRVZ|nr:hypothetical protein [Streptomyces venezuelae]QES24301.1 hypothetical protein DEJ46_38790 [Streptomyces venezuelae]
MVLSDVQLIDSHAVQALFETEDFRSFVRGCPSFLRCTTAAPAGSDPFALVTTGLHRALERGEANPGPLFARGTALGARYEEGGVIRRRLEAVARTLHHFSREAGVPLGTSAVTRPCSYRDVLEEVAELPGLPGHDYAPVERTLAYLDEHVEPSNRHRRAVLFAQLDATDPPHRTAMWNTATQAWNAAVQRTPGTDGASPRSLPKAADIGLYLGSPTDALVEPVGPRATAPAEHGMAPGNLAAVAELGWQDIAKIHQDEVVTRRRDAFQAALRAGDAAAADDALPALLRAVRRKLPASGERPGRLAWAAAETGLGLAGVGLALGTGETLGLVGPALAFGLAAERLLRGGRNRSHIVNTLMTAGGRGTWARRGEA